ncbi:MAG: OadG family protein [Peptostreptococcaceae bacterium]|jgi:sodium pump decarboxylase gamma subunit|nr:OadG family protein [Peptostreptococcaceae bacterium]
MDLVVLLDKMSTDIKSLSYNEKMLGCLIVTILAMVIVFTVLVLLMFIVKTMKNFANKPKKEEVIVKTKAVEEVVEEVEADDKELVAIISAAVAASLNTSTSKIIVKRIERLSEDPAWAQAGRIEQMGLSK